MGPRGALPIGALCPASRHSPAHHTQPASPQVWSTHGGTAVHHLRASHMPSRAYRLSRNSPGAGFTDIERVGVWRVGGWAGGDRHSLTWPARYEGRETGQQAGRGICQSSAAVPRMGLICCLLLSSYTLSPPVSSRKQSHSRSIINWPVRDLRPETVVGT